MLRALDIAGMVCPNNVFLAPMAGYTNYPYRKLCESLGAGLTFTEMVSAKGLHYGNEETDLLLYHGSAASVVGARHSERSEESRITQFAPSSEANNAAPSALFTCPPPASGAERRTMLNSPVGCERAPTEAQESATGLAAVPAATSGVGEGVRPNSSIAPPPLAAQLFGSDPAILREACESEALKDFDLIDINMGCPMPKIVKNGEGNALMEDPALTEKIVAACVGSGKRISVKMRTGVDEAHKCTAEFAKRIAGAGACLITVHGRTRDKIYTGAPDYAEIAAAKAAVEIPVIANGGVWNEKDMNKMFERTGADGVMIARAAMYDPRVFASLMGEERPPLLPLFLRLLEEEREIYGERFALVFCRKMAAFWMKGTRGAARGKQRLFAAQTTEEVASLAAELLAGI